MFGGLLRPADTDPHFLIPLRTPARKSLLSGEGRGSSSAGEESDGVENLDSESAGREVSLSAIITHCRGRVGGSVRASAEDMQAARLHIWRLEDQWKEKLTLDSRPELALSCMKTFGVAMLGGISSSKACSVMKSPFSGTGTVLTDYSSRVEEDSLEHA